MPVTHTSLRHGQWAERQRRRPTDFSGPRQSLFSPCACGVTKHDPLRVCHSTLLDGLSDGPSHTARPGVPGAGLNYNSRDAEPWRPRLRQSLCVLSGARYGPGSSFDSHISRLTGGRNIDHISFKSLEAPRPIPLKPAVGEKANQVRCRLRRHVRITKLVGPARRLVGNRPAQDVRPAASVSDSSSEAYAVRWRRYRNERRRRRGRHGR